MKKFFLLSRAMMLAIFLAPLKTAYAGAFVEPISYVSIGGGYGKVTQKIQQWEESNNTPNPCYGWLTCSLGPDVLYPRNSPSLSGSCGAGHCIRIEQYRTLKQVSDAWKAQKGVPYTATFGVDSLDASCVGLFYIDKPTPNRLQARQVPGSVCGVLPPVNQSCHVELPAQIPFGTLPANAVNGVFKQVTGQVWCTLPGSIKVFGQSTLQRERIYFDSKETFFATLTINEKNAFSGVRFTLPGNSQRQNFTLKATLNSSSPPDAGNYSANAIVFLAYL